MEPRRSPLAFNLERWSEVAASDARRTAIVRIGPAMQPELAATRLREHGAEVQSAGAGSIICIVTPDAVRSLAREPWVVAIEEPRLLFPRPAGSAS